MKDKVFNFCLGKQVLQGILCSKDEIGGVKACPLGLRGMTKKI